MKMQSRLHCHAVLLAALIAVPSLVWPLSAANTQPPTNLTNKPTTPHLPGKFIWAELVTDNVAVTRLFYGGMFGWTFRYHGAYYDDPDFIVAPPGNRPDRPLTPSHPIARPPMGSGGFGGGGGGFGGGGGRDGERR